MVPTRSPADRWAPVCEAIVRLLLPNAEVVLHDPQADQIVAIWNPLSGRAVGDASLLSELDGLRVVAPDVYGPYSKSLPDGRTLSSVSAVLRDGRGRAELVLCVNVDRSVFEDAARVLTGFAAPTQERPMPLFERDWTEILHDIVGAYVRETATPLDRLCRSDRRILLARLDAAGVLSRQRSVPAVARELRISRSTLYQLLAEVRKETTANADAS
jgi:predicted transcriptional regulator YheO